MESRKSGISVLMVPWVAHGHISPFLELAKKLTEKNFSIFLCSTPVNLNLIKNKITQENPLSIQLVELHLPSSPQLPPHYHTTNGLPTNLMPNLKKAFEMSSPNLSNLLQTINPDLVIYDFSQPWIASLASSRNIPAVQFFSFGAMFTSFMIHTGKKSYDEYPFPGIYLSESEKRKLSHMFEFSMNDVKDIDRTLEGIELSCDAILIKTCKEIEGKYIDYFSCLARKKVVPIGPLVQDPIWEDDDHQMETIRWLDNKRDKDPTIFVSFGSEYFLSKEEIKEMALGLELSRVNFIWVLGFPLGEGIRVEEALPKGFLERVGGRGMVVEGWAPQVAILGHESLGGFVSHCGWSSVMESMKCGVPIIAMAMHLDQPLNAKMVVEVGVGVEVKRDNNGGFRGEEIANAIRMVVVEKDGEVVRKKAKEISEVMKMKGDEEIEFVVEEFEKICMKKK